MKHILVALAPLLALMLAVSPINADERWTGYWEGSLELKDGAIAFHMTVSDDGALLDIPEQKLWGYPSAFINADDAVLELAWFFGGGEFLISAKPDGDGATGRFGQGQAIGSFSMQKSESPRRKGEELLFPASGGSKLGGSLLVPQGSSGKTPLLIMHSPLGQADRDGNNYSIEGRHDALLQLAEELAALGVASYRYDKRGSGLSTWLVKSESDLRFRPWVDDLLACIDYFTRDGRFGPIWLLGLNDGSIVAAQAAIESRNSDGLIIACASADSPYDVYRNAVEDAPLEYRMEGEAILAALKGGRALKAPSEFFGHAFRESLQGYLMDVFKYDIKLQLGQYKGKLLVIQGDRDMQATYGDFTILGEMAPDALGAVVPYMNHVLKEVPADVEYNNLAFSEPAFPIAAGLPELIAHTMGLAIENPF